jgi:hypothetical protein
VNTSACTECGRDGRKIRRGLCPACYGRWIYRRQRPTAAEIAPCVLCGETGPVSKFGVPIRHDGEAWGFDGDLCNRCGCSVHAEAEGNYGYRYRKYSGRSA